MVGTKEIFLRSTVMLQMGRYSVFGSMPESSRTGTQLIYIQMLMIPRLSLVILASDLFIIFLVEACVVEESLK